MTTKEHIIGTRCAGLYQLQLKPESGCPGKVIEDFDIKTQKLFDHIIEVKDRTLPPVWRIINLFTGKVVYAGCPECPKECKHCEGDCDCLEGKGAFTSKMEEECEKSCSCKCDKCAEYAERELPKHATLSR